LFFFSLSFLKVFYLYPSFGHLFIHFLLQLSRFLIFYLFLFLGICMFKPFILCDRKFIGFLSFWGAPVNENKILTVFYLNSQRISFLSLVKNCNHKGLGIYYLLSAFIFGISGTCFSVLIRIELYSSGNRIISPENQNFYNISITLHGFLMIFFLVMPGLFGGFGNYFVVIFQGSPEVVYPRVNNFSILILFLSYLFLILSLISEFGGGTGWTLYPPLSTSFMSLSPSSTGNLIFGLLISGISSCLTSLNFWTTILNLRSYYLTLKTMPLFLWALLITGGMLLLTLPILSGALLMVLADLHSNTLFFDPIFGGDPIFYQHLFWFFGHPEVYILIIPAFGIISIIISNLLQKIIFGNCHCVSFLEFSVIYWIRNNFPIICYLLLKAK
jgi:heme/copper-type cytochrome/quinol oxidase subunit 1